METSARWRNILNLPMPVIISILGPHRRLQMESLRAVYQSLKLHDCQTFVQSGNVIFRTEERDLVQLARGIENAIERKFGFHSDVILRTAAEMRDVIARNPFAERPGLDPKRFLVTFLTADPGKDARARLLELKTEPDELRANGRELYVYYPNGVGRPKLSWTAIEKVLKVSGTARNWNSITKMLAMAEKLEALK